ncbi:ABC transporter ATP-binding protein [Galactobacter valiniphilus]|uniref:ABC transporter ATP-binding protein n=1 Tax=Galactobacter valiniphilus TaxID=2676122 RepID=A0A399JDP4_9MICC|nr:ABC transporter ATP-binding protein [Galactobacter valiniphilus]RII42687.1 ABC transporter ATP-binding protein [Galactobacter valiniphilus]
MSQPLLPPPPASPFPSIDPNAAVSLRGLMKSFGPKVAVAPFGLDVPTGSFYGLVGPNGAGKTTTLSMLTGLLRPDAGTAAVHGIDVWQRPLEAKAALGVLADGVRLFDRLSGRQLVTYSGRLRGMPADEVAQRTEDLLRVMDLTDAGNKLVVDYSAGMHKKISLACAMIHAPRVLVLDEPFEAVDPVSAANIRDILNDYVRHGGTVLVSSHVMDLVQRMCTHVAVIADGQLRAAGTVDQVRGGLSLEERFVDLVGGRGTGEGLSWLHS